MVPSLLESHRPGLSARHTAYDNKQTFTLALRASVSVRLRCPFGGDSGVACLLAHGTQLAVWQGDRS